MPIYEYEHLEQPCDFGKIFDVEQSIHDKQLKKCPGCAGPLRKLISRTYISSPKTNSELRDLGFTKLVKRDDGVYENVTARDGDSRYMERGKPDTIPSFKKTIKD
ncbi:FmdB family zinc ribbon protein [Thermodesulfobacteriota bacterium]